MPEAGIVFPHQLFEENEWLKKTKQVYLVEEHLFFRQYAFHKQKIALHRAGMKYYEGFLRELKKEVVYVESGDPASDIRKLIPKLKKSGTDILHYTDTTDNWLEKRIREGCDQYKIKATRYENPGFLSNLPELRNYFQGKKHYFQTDFYKRQRLARKLLLDDNNEPLGGKWTFDTENRLRYPKNKTAPRISFTPMNEWYAEAIRYTEEKFARNPGQLSGLHLWPCTHEESKRWLKDFLAKRFESFGEYEDSMVESENFLHHSLLTPLMNVGLLTPGYVLKEVLQRQKKHPVPLNSLEGFIRQILGWREFIRGVYEWKGTEERTRNYWKHKRKIPASFWNGSTGIGPVDTVIRRVLETGYCHHIERLMVLGNFMLLCEFDPDEVYRWFMELFIDAYDWVMVPNVYGMSQFADGGLMATKPYISGSNYLVKMSDFEKGGWQETWDALFWRFIHRHRDFFLKNPRLGMMVRTWDKMSPDKKRQHIGNADAFLSGLIG